MDRCDVLVIGAGFAGATAAAALAARGLRVLVVDRREHLGGLTAEVSDGAGVLRHRYGPHCFHTGTERVRRWVERFGEWRRVDYRVKAEAGGRLWTLPVGLRTYEEWLDRPATAEAFRRWLASEGAGGPAAADAEGTLRARVGRTFYERFFQRYTRTQWGREPATLDGTLGARLPVRFDRRDGYFDDPFVALPAHGYAALFARMLDHPGIALRLGVEGHDAARAVERRHTIHTGSLDEWYGFDLGVLPYRTIRFEVEAVRRERALPVVQVNRVEEAARTRSVELAHLTGRREATTEVVHEFPEEWAPGRERLYPIPEAAARALHGRYAARAAADATLSVLGRLGTYRYLDMDRVVGESLEAAARVAARLGAARRATVGTRAAAPRVDLVVARHAEPLGWLRRVAAGVRLFVYDKGGDLDRAEFPAARVARLPNVGREAHTYLTHFAERYDDLAPRIVCCQGHPFDHEPGMHRILRAEAEARGVPAPFRWLGFVIDTDDARGRRLFVRWSRNEDGRELDLEGFCRALWGAGAPERVRFHPGGQFVVSAEAVRRRPREFWRRAARLAAEFPDGAHAFERLWDRLFGEVGVDPAVLGDRECVYLRRVRRPRTAGDIG